MAEKSCGDIVLLDITDGMPQGKALDIVQSAPVVGFDSGLIGTNDYRDTTDSDVVVITSGAGRKPGMSRDELLKINGAIVSEVAHNVANCSPDGIIIVVTNPVDAMTYLALRVSGFLPNRVLGLSGVLDGARFSSFIAAELGMPASEISALVLGGHGQNMVVLPRLSTVGGRPLTEMLPQETIARLVERTINGGAEVVGLLRVSSASYAPSAAIARMIEAIILDKKEILPCAVYLEGEYGIKDTVVGVPVKLGKNGIEEIIELKLIDEEKKALKSSAEVTRQLIDTMKLG